MQIEYGSTSWCLRGNSFLGFVAYGTFLSSLPHLPIYVLLLWLLLHFLFPQKHIQDFTEVVCGSSNQYCSCGCTPAPSLIHSPTSVNRLLWEQQIGNCKNVKSPKQVRIPPLPLHIQGHFLSSPLTLLPTPLDCPAGTAAVAVVGGSIPAPYACSQEDWAGRRNLPITFHCTLSEFVSACNTASLTGRQKLFLYWKAM